jgi:hypothetical protein
VYSVSAEALEAAVREVVELDPRELAELGRGAREFFLENHGRFVDRFTRAVGDLAGAP